MSKGRIKKNKTIETIVKNYSRDVSDVFKIKKLYLFGSAARGEMKKNSDIDLVLLSEDFVGVSFMKRMKILSRFSLEYADKVAFDVFGYTPQEFAELKKSDSPNVKQMFKEGRYIKI